MFIFSLFLWILNFSFLETSNFGKTIGRLYYVLFLFLYAYIPQKKNQLAFVFYQICCICVRSMTQLASFKPCQAVGHWLESVRIAKYSVFKHCVHLVKSSSKIKLVKVTSSKKYHVHCFQKGATVPKGYRETQLEWCIKNKTPTKHRVISILNYCI